MTNTSLIHGLDKVIGIFKQLFDANSPAFRISATAYEADYSDTSDGICPDEEYEAEFTVDVNANTAEEAEKIFSLVCYEENVDVEVDSVEKRVPTLQEWARKLTPEKRAEIDTQAREMEMQFERACDDYVDASYEAHFPEENTEIEDEEENTTMKQTMNLEQIADAILAGNFDFSGYDLDNKAELENAAQFYAEQKRIDREYQEDVPTSQPKAEQKTEHTLKDASKVVGCGTLVESAFDNYHADDDDDELIEAVPSDDDDVVVQRGYRGTPEDGEHIVKLVEYPERQQGKNGKGDFRVLRLRDVKTYLEWTAFIAEEDLMERLSQISYNNKGILSGLNKKKSFESLMFNAFSVWTCNRAKGEGVITYYDENKFQRYFRWAQEQKADAELKYATKHSKNVSNEEKAKDYQF